MARIIFRLLKAFLRQRWKIGRTMVVVCLLDGVLRCINTENNEKAPQETWSNLMVWCERISKGCFARERKRRNRSVAGFKVSPDHPVRVTVLLGLRAR